ncbi:hypothetical protein LTR92_001362 [Exophiala xenobiotica]|nr:hypothetical protein LTR92_001362 [Exophiala xenobiotica]KAK5279654.1 hypothetical protein LTR40_007484 [Exophiala xenobiotica]KAK5393692.1 hypothetical protein LTR79_008635 [Exophiala xenobiotica]KAK5414870.1 hypothetical protein LTR90_005916 [Exophiala xenobiotica]KAK5514246.1 hypothetical protein LTR21_004489 [Exophiala xenobiotica]
MTTSEFYDENIVDFEGIVHRLEEEGMLEQNEVQRPRAAWEDEGGEASNWNEDIANYRPQRNNYGRRLAAKIFRKGHLMYIKESREVFRLEPEKCVHGLWKIPRAPSINTEGVPGHRQIIMFGHGVKMDWGNQGLAYRFMHHGLTFTPGGKVADTHNAANDTVITMLNMLAMIGDQSIIEHDAFIGEEATQVGDLEHRRELLLRPRESLQRPT